MRHISLFCLIKECQSISKAAQRALLSQPTVSQHLKALESELGVSLFDRVGRKMVATQAGDIFYQYAKQIMTLSEEAHLAMEDFLGRVKGDLWVAGSNIPGQYILPELIGAFHAIYPEVRPRLQIGDSQWVVERVRVYEVELGFAGARLEKPGLSFEPFARDELILVVSRQHPMAGRGPLPIDDLPSVPLVSRERGSGTRSSWEGCLSCAELDPEALRIVAEFGSTEAVVRGVRAGLGVGIVSSRAVEEELKHGVLEQIPLDGTRLQRTFYIVKRAGRALSPAARTFEEFVRKASPSDAP